MLSDQVTSRSGDGKVLKFAIQLAWSPFEETELDRFCVVCGFLLWLINKDRLFRFERNKVKYKEASQHLLPSGILNHLCPPFSYLRHKQNVSIPTLVWAVFILLIQKRIHFFSVQHLLCVIQGPALGCMHEAKRSRMWSVPLGLSLWERRPCVQVDTLTPPWERRSCVQWACSHCCEGENHYSVSSVVWNLAHPRCSVISFGRNELVGASRQDDKSAIEQVQNVMKV